MSDISLTNSLGTDRLTGAMLPIEVSGRRASAQPSRSGRESDRLELSSHARLLGKLVAGGDVRADLVARIRREIAEGSYETAAKVEAAVDAVARELGTDR